MIDPIYAEAITAIDKVKTMLRSEAIPVMRAYCDRENITWADFGRRAGLSQNTMQNFVKDPEHPMRQGTQEKIFHVINANATLSASPSSPPEPMRKEASIAEILVSARREIADRAGCDVGAVKLDCRFEMA
jgi:hypothetical protein